MSADHLTTWAARAAVVGGVGSALLGLRRWWSERERPATGYVRGFRNTVASEPWHWEYWP